MKLRRGDGDAGCLIFILLLFFTFSFANWCNKTSERLDTLIQLQKEIRNEQRLDRKE